MWLLAIHGQNSEIIHLIEDNHVDLEDKSYKQVFYESIKCHHNDIANYFMCNFLQNKEENSQDTYKQCLKYYNFAFLKSGFINESSFCILCKYDYCTLVDNLLKDKYIIQIHEFESEETYFFHPNPNDKIDTLEVTKDDDNEKKESFVVDSNRLNIRFKKFLFTPTVSAIGYTT